MAHGVETHSLERSIRSLTTQPVRNLEKKRKRLLEDGLDEFEQQFQLPIRGRAGNRMTWSEQDLRFTTTFFSAPEQRDSPYTVPHFTFGVVIESGPPVMVTACVTGWKIDKRDAVVGCTLAIGIVDPGASGPGDQFNGFLHGTFQGFGYPEYEDAQDFPTP